MLRLEASFDRKKMYPCQSSCEVVLLVVASWQGDQVILYGLGFTFTLIPVQTSPKPAI